MRNFLFLLIFLQILVLFNEYDVKIFYHYSYSENITNFGYAMKESDSRRNLIQLRGEGGVSVG